MNNFAKWVFNAPVHPNLGFFTKFAAFLLFCFAVAALGGSVMLLLMLARFDILGGFLLGVVCYLFYRYKQDVKSHTTRRYPTRSPS